MTWSTTHAIALKRESALDYSRTSQEARATEEEPAREGEKRWECGQGGQVASRLEREAERAEQKAARTKGLEQTPGS